MRHQVANLSQPLVKWRRHPGATSIAHEQQQVDACEVVSLRNIHGLTPKDNDTAPGGNQEYRYLGGRAFLCTPAGLLPHLPPQQVISGLQFLCTLQETFSRTYPASRSASDRLRRRLNWTWGKHAVALAVRAPWDLLSRTQVFLQGVRCFSSALWATVRSFT